MKKVALSRILVLLMCLAFVFTAVSCTPQANGPDKTEASKKVLIGFQNLDTAIDYCVDVENSLKAEAEKRGIELAIANCVQDPQKALTNADSLLLQNVDLLIDFCTFADVGKVIVEKAAAQNKKVISLDVKYEGAYYFGCNNLESGKIGGRYAGEKIKKDWDGQIDLLVLTYPESAGDEVKGRVDGMRLGIEEVLGQKIPDDKVFYFDDHGQAINTKAFAADFLTAHPDDRHIVFGCLDDPTALGAISSIETAGREDDVFVLSTGADLVFRENMYKDNPPKCWIGSVGYFPEKYGTELIPYALDIIDGKDAPNEKYMTNLMVTPENIQEYYPKK